ncbi:hypothetical protein [Lapillicoccus sp.]|uniref:hypothetical protein n=1 Tax=Lapillicoccus sp. TaxID=1909287 RepID=UPI0025E47F97|nr:hypothetical protein [Lapillicoccus sp.]
MSQAASKKSVWRRGQLLITGAVFVLATVIGVDVGLHGAAVSPVASVVVSAAAAAPVAGDQTSTAAGPFDGGRGQADVGQVGGGGGVRGGSGQGEPGQGGGGGR